MRGELEAVKVCLENNALVNVQDMCEMTALMFAWTNNHVEIVRALLDHEEEKVDLELGDLSGRTAMYYTV